MKQDNIYCSDDLADWEFNSPTTPKVKIRTYARDKISLEKKGTLLQSKHKVILYAEGKLPGDVEIITKDNLLLYLGCYYFPVRFESNLFRTYLASNKTISNKAEEYVFWSHYNYPQNIAIIKFLFGSKMLYVKFYDPSPTFVHATKEKKENRKRCLRNMQVKNNCLYLASKFLYKHFNIVANNQVG